MSRIGRGSLGKRERARLALEQAASPLLFAALALARWYRSRGYFAESPTLHRVSDRLGVYPVVDHYYEPLIAPKRHPQIPVGVPRDLPAVDLAVADQLSLLARFRFQEELRAVPFDYEGPTLPYYGNSAFGPGDASILHCVIRHFKPRRLVEVGSGESTRFAARALAINERDRDMATEHVCIEPYEAPWLSTLPVRLIRSRVEEVTLDVFTALEPGDILFIDSSHVIRPRGDVVFLYQEVIPRLRPGVIVHVHDIFTPRDYPLEWIEHRRLWNEQYLVEALLAENRRVGVLLANNLLSIDYPDQFLAACPPMAYRTVIESAVSLWLQIK